MSMTSAFLAGLLKPLLVPAFHVLVVAPIVWILNRLFPPGRWKVVLFKERDGPDATEQDKRAITLAKVIGVLVVMVVVGVVSEMSRS